MCTEVLTMSSAFLPWYAIHVKANSEQRVRAHLEQKCYSVFLPTQRIRRRWADRVKIVDAPLFPGYVFCQLSGQYSAKVITTPGVLKIVGTGRQPAAIPDEEITALQRVVRVDADLEPWPYFAVGQMVRVSAGPLAGVEGRVISIGNAWRLVISVTLLQRSVAVAVEREWLLPVNETPFDSDRAKCDGLLTPRASGRQDLRNPRFPAERNSHQVALSRNSRVDAPEAFLRNQKNFELRPGKRA